MKRHLGISIFILIASVGIILLLNCRETEWQSGDYKVSWLDSSLTLSRIIDHDSSIGRVMHRISAIGEDDKWIVAERQDGTEREFTEYYYFSKKNDSKYKNAGDVVKGPFNEQEFNKIKTQLKLPDFSKRF